MRLAYTIVAAAGFLLRAQPPLSLVREAGGVTIRGGNEDCRVHGEARENPPVLGSFEKVEGGVRFRPRFPLAAGMKLVAVCGDVSVTLAGEARKLEAVTRVEAVYPSGAVVPANLLKFYVHFSRPMGRGEAWGNLEILNEAGAKVELPFLEIDQELWDRENRRLTLLFDPGRIKRGVLPREEVGTSLETGKAYTLRILASWKDAEGKGLVEDFRKTFRVGAEERAGIDVKKWTVRAPKAGGREALELRFERPLDRALAERLITVEDARGRLVGGEVELVDEERGWRFVPETRWLKGEYRVRVDHRLEDLAGNRPGRPFDVDVFDTITKKPVAETTAIGFRVER